MLILVGLIVVAVAELYVFVQTAQWLGFFTALFTVIAVSFVGFALVKREGVRTLGRFRFQARQGQLPSGELADAVALLIAGGLLLLPGLITDAAGLLLLVPPVRALLRGRLLRTARHRSGTVIIDVELPHREP
jgi:UPF0716 protein FxsA